MQKIGHTSLDSYTIIIIIIIIIIIKIIIIIIIVPFEVQERNP